MEKIKSFTRSFTKGEILLWGLSLLCIVVSFWLFDKTNFLTLIASVIGATSLIFNAKGNAVGQFLMIIFSVLYGIISFSFSYYGEMITYLGMTAPMALMALIVWMKNPYEGKQSQVKVNRLTTAEIIWMLVLAAGVTFVFYFILKTFHTANLALSTLSVTTSFLAAYLTFRRSTFYALCYAANDVVLIVLWLLAAASDLSYLSVAICFVTFLVNDLYGFVSWKKMYLHQQR